MRRSDLAILTIACLAVLSAPTIANARSCHELWTERNAIYKAHGYCFKTERAINYFGNGGCRYRNENDIPLSGRERRLIAEVARQERAQGCN